MWFGVLQKYAGRFAEEEILLPLPGFERCLIAILQPNSDWVLAPVGPPPALENGKWFHIFVSTPYLRKEFLPFRPRMLLMSVRQ